MSDYIYLLENRLSPAQRSALRHVREVARSKALTVFLVGGAVRDLTSGSPVRDLDVVVQGNALKLKKDIERVGGELTGEHDPGQALFVRFPGGVRMEIGSTLSVTFAKPGKAVVKPATILDDLRRRDFTANAMALSLNEGSYGLLMDPLNGVADIENRQLRLVSNYGFIEDPVRMIRAARLMARLGWTLDEKTQARYQTGIEEGYIAAMPEFHRGYETEEIVHEEEPLRVLKRLEAEGWMQHLAPYWTSAKVNAAELEKLRESLAQLQMQGIQPDTAAAHFPLLTARLTPKEIAELKQGFPRQGFVKEIDALEGEAREFAAQLNGKGAALPSQAWKLIMGAKPEAVLWVAYSTRSAALQAKFKSFYTEWGLARHKMPYSVMQEMRIQPDVAGYDELLEKLFFELMDGRLTTPEEMKAFLEPYSPPAPPPQVSVRRMRAAKKETKPSKSRVKKAAAKAEEGDGVPAGGDGEAEATPESPTPVGQGASGEGADSMAGAVPATAAPVKTAPVKTAPVKSVPAKAAAVKAVPVKAVPVKAAPVKAAPTKTAPATKGAVVKGMAAKAPVKAAAGGGAAKVSATAAKAALARKAAGSATKSAARGGAGTPGSRKTAATGTAGRARTGGKAGVKTGARQTARPGVKVAPAKKVAAKKSPAKSPAGKSVAKTAAKKSATAAKGGKTAAKAVRRR